MKDYPNIALASDSSNLIRSQYLFVLNSISLKTNFFERIKFFHHTKGCVSFPSLQELESDIDQNKNLIFKQIQITFLHHHHHHPMCYTVI
jgi:hypothetical protein